MGLRTRVAWQTDKGRVRLGNEDAVGVRMARRGWERERRGDLFVVCDGMGGHAGGEVAAQIAIQRILDEYFREQANEPADALAQAVQLASETIRRRAAMQPDLQGMGCTCVAAAILGSQLVVAHVGDSRAYLLRNSQLRQLTEDHNWVSEQVRAGMLSAEDAATHPMRNVVTRSLGIDQVVEVAMDRVTLEAGDVLLLCSDGLSGVVAEREIAKRLASQDHPGRIANQLVAAANAAGGPDNVTALVVCVDPVSVPAGRVTGLRRLVLLGLFGFGCAGLGFFAGVEVVTTPVVLEQQPTIAVPAVTPAPVQPSPAPIVTSTATVEPTASPQ